MIDIASTQDIFYITASAVILITGILLAWTLYYLCASLRDMRRVTRDIRTRVETFWQLVELAREKLLLGGAVFKIAATGIKELAEHMRSFSEREETHKKKKASTNRSIKK